MAYKEIKELFYFCLDNDIKAAMDPLFDGYKITFINGSDVIQHRFSYGSKIGCVEPAIGCDEDYTAVSLDMAKSLVTKHKDKLNTERI